MTTPFPVPVVLFLFKRKDTLLRTIDILREIQAKKVILVGDAARNEEEKPLVDEVRQSVVDAIDWDCEVEKRFAETNQGVFAQIGLGAKDILAKEGRAIFLEDDNLPEKSFFGYCEYLLDKYESDPRILWICGTNYLGEYKPEDGASYVFTRHLLPCGWASWGEKFNKYYDTTLEFLDHKEERKTLRSAYVSRALWKQQLCDAGEERLKIVAGKRPISWDYHMVMSVVHNGLYGIAPCVNQIRNTGMDDMATHGGTSNKNTMAWRFCGMPSHPLEFPLVDPKDVHIDETFERKISKIRLKPFWSTRFFRFKLWIRRKIFHLEDDTPFSNAFRRKK